MQKKLRASVLALLVIVGIGCFAYSNYLYRYYLVNAPRSPNYTTGEVIETNEHGAIFYLTEESKIVYIILLPSGGGFIILAVAIAKFWRPSN